MEREPLPDAIPPQEALLRRAMRWRISARSFRPRSGLPRFWRTAKRASACRSARTCVTKLSKSLCTLVPVERAAPSSALCRMHDGRIVMCQTALEHFRAGAFQAPQRGDKNVGVLHNFHAILK